MLGKCSLRAARQPLAAFKPEHTLWDNDLPPSILAASVEGGDPEILVRKPGHAVPWGLGDQALALPPTAVCVTLSTRIDPCGSQFSYL
jgi:hypothetical protein